MIKNIGLICEGGGTKAAYSAGVLQCLLDCKIYLPYTAGISAGAEILLAYSEALNNLQGSYSIELKGSNGETKVYEESRDIYKIKQAFKGISSMKVRISVCSAMARYKNT